MTTKKKTEKLAATLKPESGKEKKVGLVPLIENQPDEEKVTLMSAMAEMAAFEQVLIANGGELSPEMEEELNQSEIVLAGKLDSYGYIWERCDVVHDYWDGKAKEFVAIAKGFKTLKESLRRRMGYGIQALKKTEMCGTRFRFALANTTGKVQITDETLIPKKFKKTKKVIELDMVAIKALLTAGKKVKGCVLVKTPSIRKYANRKVS